MPTAAKIRLFVWFLIAVAVIALLFKEREKAELEKEKTVPLAKVEYKNGTIVVITGILYRDAKGYHIGDQDIKLANQMVLTDLIGKKVTGRGQRVSILGETINSMMEIREYNE